MPEKRPRLVDPGYLAWLRTRHCVCGCLQGPPCDAAHVRASSLAYDKPLTGGARKPDDKWALPLKHAHHMEQSDYKQGEIAWWLSKGVRDVFALCQHYYALYGGDGGKPKPRRTAIKPRLPKEQRARMQSRPFPKIKRKIRSKKR